MKKMFKKRRHRFAVRCQKYLRYVFNDHFVLVLVFLMGFVMVQYSQLLKHFPANPWPISLAVSGILLIFLVVGRVATYLEEPDKLFLLSQEQAVLEELKQAKKRSFSFWSGVQALIWLALLPLFLKLGLSSWMVLLLFALSLLVRWMLLSKKVQSLQENDRLNWTAAISLEQQRQQTILKFFSLFTNVKGISTSVKRRAYLDRLTGLLKKESASVWTNLYLRAFLRGGDYLSLSLRLLGLSILVLVSIRNPLMSAALAVLFNYLLLFQLLSLYHHYDYQYLTNLFPVDKGLKQKNLLSFLQKLSYLMLLVELLFSWSWEKMGILAIGTLLISQLYLRYKVKKMID